MTGPLMQNAGRIYIAFCLAEICQMLRYITTAKGNTQWVPKILLQSILHISSIGLYGFKYSPTVTWSAWHISSQQKAIHNGYQRYKAMWEYCYSHFDIVQALVCMCLAAQFYTCHHSKRQCTMTSKDIIQCGTTTRWHIQVLTLCLVVSMYITMLVVLIS